MNHPPVSQVPHLPIMMGHLSLTMYNTDRHKYISIDIFSAQGFVKRRNTENPM